MSDVRHPKPERGETSVRAVLRDRRQLTVPRAVCEELGIRPGDGLDLRVEDGSLIIRPGRVAALEALEAIQQALQESGITEEEWLESGRQVREELVREKWPHLFPADGPKK
jgi:AbrB family looped-hinge helix DNA binding protein